MSLTDAEIRSLKPTLKSYKKADSKGLYVEISPNGSKLWRLKYRIGGKEKRLALGVYPDVSLGEVRKRRDIARGKIEQGIDPSMERQRDKAAAKLGADNTFFVIGEEYISKIQKEGRAKVTVEKAEWLLSLLKPAIGSMPIDQVDAQMLLAVLRKLEGRGTYETAKRTRSLASRIFRYAVATGRAAANPAALLSGALISVKAKHYAAILNAEEFGVLLRAIDSYTGSPITKFALQIAPHVFVRPGELRHAEWQEFDFDGAVWKIPAGKMKARLPHAVPLSIQVIDLLSELRHLTGPNGYVFQSLHSSKRPMSENTMNIAFRRMGFGRDEITSHGLRATASTLLNESGKWNPDAIERALAHSFKNAVRSAYHRGEHWEERVEMAAWWSNYLTDLKKAK